MKQYLTDEQWALAKAAAEGKEVDLTVTYPNPPKYNSHRRQWLVVASDGTEHIFDRRDEQEAQDFYDNQNSSR